MTPDFIKHTDKPDVVSYLCFTRRAKQWVDSYWANKSQWDGVVLKVYKDQEEGTDRILQDAEFIVQDAK